MVDMAPHAGGARFVQADDVETMTSTGALSIGYPNRA